MPGAVEYRPDPFEILAAGAAGAPVFRHGTDSRELGNGARTGKRRNRDRATVQTRNSAPHASRCRLASRRLRAGGNGGI